MNPRHLSELIAFLKQHALFPKRSLSQNFLVDANILQKVAKEAHITAGDTVVEIGPGPGALTITLIEAGAHVLAIEIDKRFATLLPSTPSLTVRCEDFLEASLPDTPFKVVASIPYHISSSILYKLGKHAHLIEEAHLIVQKDFAKRVVKKEGEPEDFLSLFVSFFFSPSIPFLIGKNCFYPKPKVDSALLSLRPKKSPAVAKEPFFAFLRLLFQNKRKMIRSTLGIPHITTARPEELSLEELVLLYTSLEQENLLPPLSLKWPK